MCSRRKTGWHPASHPRSSSLRRAPPVQVCSKLRRMPVQMFSRLRSTLGFANTLTGSKDCVLDTIDSGNMRWKLCIRHRSSSLRRAPPMQVCCELCSKPVQVSSKLRSTTVQVCSTLRSMPLQVCSTLLTKVRAHVSLDYQSACQHTRI